MTADSSTAWPHATDADQRKDSRRNLVLPAVVESGGRSEKAVILDISTRGCLLELDHGLAVGSKLQISLNSGATKHLSAHVVWAGARLLGCEFDVPLSAAAVAGATARGTPAANAASDGAMSLEQLAVAIGTARRRAGLSATDLARMAGVSRPTLWAWETGRTQPTEKNLERLRDVLESASSDPREAAALFPSLPARDGLNLDQIVESHRQAIAREANVQLSRVRITIVYD